MGKGNRAEPLWQHHSLSLQERLGLTDEEVDRLRRSPRSGLPAPVTGDAGLDRGGGVFAENAGGSGGVGGRRDDAFLGRGVSMSPGSGVVDYDGESAAAAAAVAEDRMREKMTGRSAGGPHTAVGYLLGELRMRPEEVKE